MSDLGSTVTVQELDGATVIAATGDFDLSNLAPLRDALVGATGERRTVVLDLAGTTFVDSTVLGAITGALRKAQRIGGCFRIAGPRPNIRRVLQLMALDTVIDVYESVAAAVADPCEDVDEAG